MGICKFFLEGYCKYGTNCRFDHIDPYSRNYETLDDRRPIGTSILKAASSGSGSRQDFGGHEYGHIVNQSFQHQNYQQKYSKFNVQEIMEIISKDILQSEKGNQWQLSCYSPLKELPNLPGLEDHSPEELRWECYKASQNGSIPIWQAIVQQLYANAAKNNNELKRKDTGYSIIDRWLRGAEENIQSNSTSFGSSQVSPSVFGNTNANSSVFGGNSALPPYFVSGSVETSMFGNSAQTSNFGGNTSSVFGGNTSFGGSSSFLSPNFGSTNNQPGSDSSFSFSLQQQHPANLQMNPGSGFPFGSNSVQTVSTHPQSTQPLYAGVTNIDSQEYSKVEELTNEEIEAFKADKFSFCSIPTKPPPRTLCHS